MKLVSFLFLLLALFSFTTCGNSPLMNHTTAGPQNYSENTHPNGTPATGCGLFFEKSGLCATLSWDTPPSTDEEGMLTIQFFDPTTGEASEAKGKLVVQLWMPSMGHGSSPVEITQKGMGLYSAKRIYFTMPGEWEVRIQLKRGNTLIEQTVLSVKI